MMVCAARERAAGFPSPGKTGGVFSNLWKIRRAAAVALGLLACAVGARGGEAWLPLVTPALAEHLTNALDLLDMTAGDLAFEKDVGQPLDALRRTRDLLRRPLELPGLAGEVWRAAADTNTPALWDLAEDLLEVGPATASATGAAAAAGGPAAGAGLSTNLADALRDFQAAAQRADSRMRHALGRLAPAERRHLAAACLAEVFNAEDHAAVRAVLLAIGIQSQELARVIQDGLALDPQPAATRFLELAGRAGLGELLAAGRELQQAVEALAARARRNYRWPRAPVVVPTPAGEIVVGTVAPETYDRPALLILDPGGNDVYRGLAGQANGLDGRYLAAVIDLDGADQYLGDGLLGPGSALFGAAVLDDTRGDDLYRAAYTGQGAAWWGAAWLADGAGDDVYRAGALAQGAGYYGLGVLRDGGGNDLYDLGFAGQGYAGVRGVGLLVDRAGNDRYLAGGREIDHGRFQDRYLSLAQGFATGMRPYAGGGIAALADLGGNDVYRAEIFGQGAGYWYAAGLLLDAGGHDSYQVYEYGQGAGIHLSAGLLADGGGDDTYTGAILAQGCAHDYAVGMLFDRGGDDTYTADHHAQGRAMNNGLALLADEAGDDGYFGRQPDACQGIGNDGGPREYGSLALLLDLAGSDRYTCGAQDGSRLLRPDFGIVYDVRTNAAGGP